MIKAVACRHGDKADFELPSYYEDAFNSVDDLRSTLDRSVTPARRYLHFIMFLPHAAF